MKLDVGAGGALAWLPQETILFDQVRLRRTIDVDLAPDASLLLAEGVMFGRSAMGETVRNGHFSDRWRVRVGGALVFAESLRLDGAIATRLAQRGGRGRSGGVASVLEYPGDDKAVAAVRAMEKISQARSAYRPGTAWPSRGWLRPTVRRSITISSAF